jgi:hypothetical protein
LTKKKFCGTPKEKNYCNLEVVTQKVGILYQSLHDWCHFITFLSQIIRILMAIISKPIGQWTFQDACGTLGAWWRNPGIPGNPG